MLLIIISGWIDLSVGSVVAVIGASAAVMIVKWDVNWMVAVAICLVLGAIIGAWHGFWIAYIKIPAFVATLGGYLIFRGLTLVLLQGESIGPFPVGFQRISTGFIPDIFHVEGIHLTTVVLGGLVCALLWFLDYRNRLNQRKYGFEVLPIIFFIIKNLVISAAIMGLCWLLASYKGLPNVLVLMGLLIVLYSFVSNNTVVGRRIYAMGGNEKAARLSGVNTARLLFGTFVNMGVLAALAGVIVAARLNSATPNAGTGFELDVIAACFIGGASASGGIGKVIGAVVGAFVIGVLNNGMSIMGLGIDWQQVIKGLVLLVAVFFDVYGKNKN
jgi:putative multiple sugar transport system permease protein